MIWDISLALLKRIQGEKRFVDVFCEVIAGVMENRINEEKWEQLAPLLEKMVSIVQHVPVSEVDLRTKIYCILIFA